MITLTFDKSDMNREIADVAGRLEDSATVHDIIGEVLLDETRERIQQEKSPDGSNWPALHPVALDNRRSKSGILCDSGELFRSIHKNTTSDKAEVGTNLNHPKVWVNQYGATIRPRRVPFLLIPYMGGKLAAKQVTIPARPYIGIGRGDEELVKETLEGYLEG